MVLLTKYFFLTYLLSWTFFITSALLSNKNQANFAGLSLLQQILIFIGIIIPSLVALWLTSRSGIPGQTQKLLNRIGRWKVHIKWYLFAGAFIVVLKLLVACLYKIITGSWPELGKETWYMMLIGIIFSTWIQAGEEIGWRGFALPQMTARFGLVISTLLLGIFWAFWHLPLFFIKGTSVYGQSFSLYFIQVIAMSVIIGWLYWRTQGSLLLVMIMHAAVNNTSGIVPSVVSGANDPLELSNSLVGWLTVMLLWVFAAYCLIRMRYVKYLE
ncbi:MAG: CPBP family intramembrane glutamic endopeptidase [Flavisolibacter sp.]